MGQSWKGVQELLQAAVAAVNSAEGFNTVSLGCAEAYACQSAGKRPMRGGWHSLVNCRSFFRRMWRRSMRVLC